MFKFLKDESGATAIEYGLIAASIGLVLVISAKPLGQAIGLLFDNLAANMTTG